MRLSMVVLLLFLAAQAGFADLTVRQQTVVKFGPAVPAGMLDTVKQQMGNALPAEMILRVKASRCSSSGASVGTLIDSDKGEITLINSKTKEFAAIPATGLPSKLANAMPQLQTPAGVQQMLQNLKIDVQTKKTGQTEVIAGIRTEEYLVVLSMAMPGLGTGIKMEMHNWTAAPEELIRIPALKELAVCASHSTNTSDLNQALQKMFAQMPGVAEKFLGPLEELRKNSGSPSLRTQTAVHMPALTALVGGQAAPGFDPNAPLVEVTMNLASLSTDPIPDSVFAVPGDYKSVPIEDLIKAMMPTAQAARPATPVRVFVPPRIETTSPVVATTPPAPPLGAFRVGNGVSPPVPISSPEPDYAEEARRARVQGTVTLSLIVDADGNPQNIRVVKPLDPGLDQKAIEAVRTWKFQPGQKDGKPVTVMASVQVNFRLVDNPPAPQQ